MWWMDQKKPTLTYGIEVRKAWYAYRLWQGVVLLILALVFAALVVACMLA
jgi:hypothetical protein